MAYNRKFAQLLACSPELLADAVSAASMFTGQGGSQTHDLQRDALIAAGGAADQIYEDSASGHRDDRPGLDACLKALRGEPIPMSIELAQGRDMLLRARRGSSPAWAETALPGSVAAFRR